MEIQYLEDAIMVIVNNRELNSVSGGAVSLETLIGKPFGFAVLAITYLTEAQLRRLFHVDSEGYIIGFNEAY